MDFKNENSKLYTTISNFFVLLAFIFSILFIFNQNNQNETFYAQLWTFFSSVFLFLSGTKEEVAKKKTKKDIGVIF